MEKNFVLGTLFQTALLFAVIYLCGLLVRHKNVKVNYTRKIYHFSVFFAPFLMQAIFPYHGTAVTTIIGLGLGICTLAMYVKPLRTRVPVLATAFLTIDRPEDRPYTVLWATTQLTATYIALIPFILYFTSIGKPHFLLVPILINAVGDGLAEPVGVRFGKHKYKTRAIFSKREYTRSVEGSACVFIVSVVVLFLFRTDFTSGQFILSLGLIPILMTLAEAFAPHTWDSPFLALIGGGAVALIYNLPL